MSVISGRTATVVATITIAPSPSGLAVNSSPSPMTGNTWIAKTSAGQVTVLSGRTYKMISTVRVGQDLGSIAIDPLTGAGYVANSGSDTVSVLRWHK